MTNRAPRPTADEIRTVAESLAKYDWPGARKQLRPYLNGEMSWDMALRTIRLMLKKVVADTSRGSKIPVGVRAQLTDFAARYGTQTRGMLSASPMTARYTVRFGSEHDAAIRAAAKAQRISVTDFVRNAAILAAESTGGPHDKRTSMGGQ